MDNIQVKPVDVLGDTIIAAKDDKGQVWAGVSYFCKALGMNNVQKDTQVDKVKTDKTLNKGYRKFPVGVFDQSNETIAIRLDFIPIWLAKIQITKKMEQDHPELADKLLEYQLKAKDILAEAFMPKQNNAGDVQGQIKLLAQGTTELYEKVDTLEQRFNKFEDELPVTGADIDHIQTAVRKKGIQSLGGKQSNAYKDISTRTFVYADIQCELRRQFGVKRYREIKHKDAPDALRIVNSYQLPIALKNRVDMVNAQETLDLGGVSE